MSEPMAFGCNECEKYRKKLREVADKLEAQTECINAEFCSGDCPGCTNSDIALAIKAFLGELK